MDQPITFEFDTPEAAAQAADTLQELGYKTRASLNIFIDRGDLTSALEIAQAYGGQMAHSSEYQEERLVASAYEMDNMDNVAIPAHVVNEDFPENYLQPELSSHYEDNVGTEELDPSGDEYDHFSAGVHL